VNQVFTLAISCQMNFLDTLPGNFLGTSSQLPRFTDVFPVTFGESAVFTDVYPVTFGEPAIFHRRLFRHFW